MAADTLHPVISHGTTETRDLQATRRFFEEFLGLDVIQPFPMAIYASSGQSWRLVCVKTGRKLQEQGVENRFCLHVNTSADVEDARAAALAARDEYGIRAVSDLVSADGVVSFTMQDLNFAWWEVAHRPARPLETTKDR